MLLFFVLFEYAPKNGIFVGFTCFLYITRNHNKLLCFFFHRRLLLLALFEYHTRFIFANFSFFCGRFAFSVGYFLYSTYNVLLLLTRLTQSVCVRV